MKRRLASSGPIPTAITGSVKVASKSIRAVQQDFNDLLELAGKISLASKTGHDFVDLFQLGLRPQYYFSLFDKEFFLTSVKQIPELRFFICYVVERKKKPRIFARIFYKDLSLCWRSASHFAIENDGAIWIGKGSVREIEEGGQSFEVSNESTTDLPFEMQDALEGLIRKIKRPRGSLEMIEMVLRRGSNRRVAPFPDFEVERKKAASDLRNLINRGLPVAWFSKQGDPKSLVFQKGYAPDFRKGLMEQTKSYSTLYGGNLERFRVLSCNHEIQFYFLKSPLFAWLLPAQALTTQLSTYGVRTIDVVADDDLFIPPYEYHHFEETESGPELYSQIPEGYVGEVCPIDELKSDASAWIESLPVIQEFRKTIGS
ncbi:MAG: hypothetical protein AAF623_14970 [Planctomycetota bacterium]